MIDDEEIKLGFSSKTSPNVCSDSNVLVSLADCLVYFVHYTLLI